MGRGNSSMDMVRSDSYPIIPLARLSRYPSALLMPVPPLSLYPASCPAPLPPYPFTPIPKLCVY